VSILGNPVTFGGGSIEMIGSFSTWKSSTGTNYTLLDNTHADLTGEHFAEYFSVDDAAHTLTVLKNCTLDIVINVRVASSTYRANTCVITLTRDGTSTDIATATDNATRTVNLHKMKFYVGDVLLGTQYNKTEVATTRTCVIYIYNP